METLFTVIFSLLAVAGGVLTITRRNPLASAVSLVVSFLAVAGLYALLSAPFVAVMQVLVYAGAIMVLVLFVIMLLNLPEEEFAQEKISRIRLFLGILIGVPLLLVFVYTWATVDFEHLRAGPEGKTAPSFGSIHSVGELMFTDYLYPFEIISVLLLVAIVGAVILAKRHLD